MLNIGFANRILSANLVISSSCGGSEPCEAGCNVHPRKKPAKNPDFSDLQYEVMEYWESMGHRYRDAQLVADDPTPVYESVIHPKYQEILDNPMTCIYILGFDSIANYLLSKEL